MLDKQQVIKDLKQVLVEDLFVEVPESDIKPEDSMMNDLGLDSVGFVELISIVEDKYGFQLRSEEATSENFRNLEVLSDFILRKTAGDGQREGDARVAAQPTQA